MEHQTLEETQERKKTLQKSYRLMYLFARFFVCLLLFFSRHIFQSTPKVFCNQLV